jgi:Flp pilus assembly protein TadD
VLIACIATLTGCTSWFGGSSLFSSKKSTTFGSSSTSTATAATSTPGSLFSKKKASPELNVATARLCESRGDFAGAAAQYEAALKTSPDYVPALLSYAHLQDHQNKLGEATKLYERAVKVNPKEATAYNDLGLCLARRGMAADALSAMGKAVQLQPDKALYRNNLAVVLVDQHRIDDALSELRAVDTEAVANYDIGILLEQRKQDALAQAHFQRALELDPQFTDARLWNEHLANRAAALAAAQPGRAQQVASPETRIASVPTSMQRPPLYGAPANTAMGGPQPMNAAVPPMPDTAPRIASVPTSMQRPMANGGPAATAAAGSEPNGSAMPPTPESLGIHYLPPVQ